MAKLEMFKADGVAGSGAGGGRAPGEAVASVMKKYQDLKEEYRLYRKRAMHAIQVMETPPHPTTKKKKKKSQGLDEIKQTLRRSRRVLIFL